MENRKEVKAYLKKRVERLKVTSPKNAEKIQIMNELIANAKEVPSEKCIKKEHEFLLMTTIDTEDEAVYYFKCEHCNEVILTKQVRLADDLMNY